MFMERIDIRNITGEVILSTPINEGCKRKYELMKEDYITLKFSLETPVFFGLGCTVDCDFGAFEVCDIQKPTYNDNTGGYDYELRLDAYYWKWKNKIFKYTPETAGQEASWNLTATLDVHAGIILRNLKALGYNYKGTEYSFSIDSSVENKPQSMSYSNISILDALFEMAKKWDCECWIADNVINFGKLEFSTPVNFEIGKNVESMSRSDSKSDFATRLYVFGSEKNLPANYRKAEQDMVVNGVIQKRLMLPEGTPYIDAYPNMTEAEAVEQVIVFDDVFPKTECVVGEVKSYTSTITDEETKEKHTETFYYFTDTSGFVFKKEYRLPNEDLKVQFQSGKLNGMEFVCTFRAKGEMFEGNVLTADVYEVASNEDYGRKLPDSTLCPAKGDKFILIGWDSTKIGDTSLITTAEKELKKKGDKAMDKMKIDTSTYSCKMMSDTIYSENGLHNLYEAGQKVNLINKAFFENGRVSRIIGFEYALDIPYDSPTYIVGETSSYSRIGDLEEKLDELVLNGQTFVGGNGSGVYLITSYDQTPATEKNTFSAKRLVRELSKLLRKDSPDSTAYLLKLLGGAEFGQFIENLPTRTGAKIDSEGNGMFTTLSAKQMRILTLIINKLTALAGDFVMTESGEIESVERINDRTFRLTMVRKHDNDITDLEVDDVLRANLEDLKVNNVSYMGWYRVLSKNTQDNTLNVVMYPASECEGNVNYPPVANMIVHRWGNATNEERQRCWYISSPEGRIVYLTGVYKPKLESSNYSSFYGLPVMLDFLNDKGINPKEPYLWVRGLIVQDIIRVDYQGNVEADIVDRGLYDPAVARGPDPYLCRAKRSTNGRFETHDVWANSCRYRCLKTGTLEVPKWNAVDWVQISGDTELYIKFEKPNGDAFFDVIDCPIIVHVFRGVEEITEDIPDTDIAWSRESGDAASDLAWPSQHPNEKKKIHLVDADCPGESTRFTCTVYVRDGEFVREVQAIETINN